MSTLNPLEQKARSSFIKGILITAVIAVIIIAFLGMKIYQMNGAEQERLAGQKSVIVLTKDVVSGELITQDMFKTIKLDAEAVPSGATNAFSTLQGYFLEDDYGNQIVTRLDSSTNEYKKYVKFASSSTDEQETLTEVFQDEAGVYYYMLNGERTDIIMKDTPIVSKVALGKNSVVTEGMITTYNEVTTDDLREEEYTSLVLPTTLVTDDTIDIRLRLPDGRDYIVLSKKKVTVPSLGDSLSASSIIIKVKESEILTMSAAIVDAYKIQGSKLYAIKYVEPGLQDAAESTYIPSSETLQLIQSDPNIVQTAKNELIQYYNSNYESYRANGIQKALNAEEEETKKSLQQSGTSSEASTLSSQRQQYLQSMAE